MLIYIFIAVLTLFLTIFESQIDIIRFKKKTIKTRVISFVILFTILLLLGFFKSDHLGVDQLNYRYYYYELYKNNSFLEIITPKFDVGYILLNWIVARIYDSFWFFCAIAYMITFSIMSYVIYKKSSNVAMSYLIYIFLGLLFFDFTILRQALALSICLLGLTAIEERKFLKFFVIVAIASLFHSTALIFLLLYPMCDQRVQYIKIQYKVIFLVLLAVMSKVAMPLIVSVYQLNDYSKLIVSGQGYNLLIYFIVFFAYIKYCSGYLENNEKTSALFESCTSTVYFQVVALSFSLFTRLNYYPLAILVILIPNIFDRLNHEWRYILELPMLALLIFYFYLQIMGSSAPIPYVSIF